MPARSQLRHGVLRSRERGTCTFRRSGKESPALAELGTFVTGIAQRPAWRSHPAAVQPYLELTRMTWTYPAAPTGGDLPTAYLTRFTMGPSHRGGTI